MKKYRKNVESRIINGSLSDRPDREHGNPLKPDRTHDDAGIQLGQYDRLGFRRIAEQEFDRIIVNVFHNAEQICQERLG